MILPLILLITLLVVAVSMVAYAVQSGRQRREVLTRADGGVISGAQLPGPVLLSPE